MITTFLLVLAWLGYVATMAALTTYAVHQSDRWTDARRPGWARARARTNVVAALVAFVLALAAGITVAAYTKPDDRRCVEVPR